MSSGKIQTWQAEVYVLLLYFHLIKLAAVETAIKEKIPCFQLNVICSVCSLQTGTKDVVNSVHFAHWSIRFKDSWTTSINSGNLIYVHPNSIFVFPFRLQSCHAASRELSINTTYWLLSWNTTDVRNVLCQSAFSLDVLLYIEL